MEVPQDTRRAVGAQAPRLAAGAPPRQNRGPRRSVRSTAHAPIFRSPRCSPVACVAVAALVQPAALAAADGADARFEALGKRYVDEFGRYAPVSATQLGDHRIDGELDDLSAAGRARTLAWTQGLLRELQAIDRAKLIAREPGRRRDAREPAALRGRGPRRNTATGRGTRSSTRSSTGQAIYGLLAREFAPLPERLRSVTSRLEKLPRCSSRRARTSCPARVPAIHAETAVKQNPGVLSLVDELVVPQPRPAARRRSRAAREGDRDCARRRAGAPAVAREGAAAEGEGRVPDRARALRREARVRADVAALPAPRSASAPRARLARRARRCTTWRARCSPAARARRRRRPSRRRPSSRRRSRPRSSSRAPSVRRARASSTSRGRRCARRRSSCVRKDFVTVPDEPLDIILMPEFQRGVAVAYCDSPGPLDKGQRTFYAVSPIPEDWTRRPGRLVPARIQHALDREPDDPRGDAGPLPADRALEPLPVDRCARCSAPARSSRAGPSTPSA